MKQKPSPGTDSPSGRKEVFTTGEVFDDGLLELLRHPQCCRNLALMWSGKRNDIIQQFERDGRVYVPAQGAPVQKMRLPTGQVAYGSAGQLFADVEQVLQTHTGLTREQAKLATYFVFATHFLEWLQSAPCLLIGGLADAQAIQLLTVLNCLCRHPKKFSGLHQVPASWLVGTSTLLVYAPASGAKVLGFLERSVARDFISPRQGCFQEPFSAKAIYHGLDNPTGPGTGSCLQVMLNGSAFVPLWNERIELQIAENFQNKMLAYRIDNFKRVMESTFSVPEFTGDLGSLARVLGRCIVDDDRVLEDLISLLRRQDQFHRQELCGSVPYALLEALLALCHKGSPSFYVKEVTDRVNTILGMRGRSEADCSYRKVGSMLKAYGIVRTRDKNGYRFAIDREVNSHVHELARLHGIQTVDPRAMCECCGSGRNVQ